ncbi:triose-phosphate transporter family-domain-containing protein [Chytriomyces cf. hyalinus JEL632]|nr:triose-phosphate transporter family-domain-containing protein [Chytriomyces cf. hyalinus JEL632]KAI8846056.1 triose-phosphate transporter family-domain-containing protein [Chytriomyces cf. hyalinus JEL632]
MDTPKDPSNSSSADRLPLLSPNVFDIEKGSSPLRRTISGVSVGTPPPYTQHYSQSPAPTLSSIRLQRDSKLLEQSLRDNAPFIVVCLLWYLASSVTSNVAKELLTVFRYPLTLSWIQFAFVAVGCLLVGAVQCYILRIPNTGVRWPTPEAFRTTAPLTLFLISGHAFSSMAISRVPVSFAHTIKALSPLFTILIYKLVFKVNYAAKVYVALVPLTLGVMLVCTNKLSFHLLGFLCALISTLIFVVQNIVSKTIFNKQATRKHSKRMDKFNLLFYSSITSFFVMAPIWWFADGLAMVSWGSTASPAMGPLAPFEIANQSSNPLATATADLNQPSFNWTDSVSTMPIYPRNHTDNHTHMIITGDPRITASASHITRLFLLNGVTHFAQAAFSFTVLAQVSSPVTFSIASLFKRIVVIVASLVYFGEARGVGVVQGVGLVLTFLGLYMYDQAKMEVRMEGPDGHTAEEVSFLDALDAGAKKKRRDSGLPV